MHYALQRGKSTYFIRVTNAFYRFCAQLYFLLGRKARECLQNSQGMGGFSEEESAPTIEAFYSFLSVAFQTVAGLLHTLLAVEVGLGEELVGKADDLFLHTDRHHLPVGNG